MVPFLSAAKSVRRYSRLTGINFHSRPVNALFRRCRCYASVHDTGNAIIAINTCDGRLAGLQLSAPSHFCETKTNRAVGHWDLIAMKRH